MLLPLDGVVLPPEPSTDVDYRWATVTSLSPLRVRLDGEDVELGVTPVSLIDPQRLVAGERVWTQRYNRRLLILGTADGGAVSLATVLARLDALEAEGTYQDYTATMSTSDASAWTMGTGGANWARYSRVGNRIHAFGEMTWGTGSTWPATATFQVSAPRAAATNHNIDQFGKAYWSLAAGRNPNLMLGITVIPFNSSTLTFRVPSTTTIGDLNTWVGGAYPAPMASTEVLRWEIDYECLP